jgi:hypothetical protein
VTPKIPLSRPTAEQEARAEQHRETMRKVGRQRRKDLNDWPRHVPLKDVEEAWADKLDGRRYDGWHTK